MERSSTWAVQRHAVPNKEQDNNYKPAGDETHCHPQQDWKGWDEVGQIHFGR